MLDLVRFESHRLENDACSHAERVGGESHDILHVLDRIKVIEIHCGSSHGCFDVGGGNETGIFVGIMLVDSQRSCGVVQTAELRKSGDDAECVCDWTESGILGVASEDFLFSVLQVFLCPPAEFNSLHLFGSAQGVVMGEETTIGAFEPDVSELERLRLAADIKFRLFYIVVVAVLGPFSTSEARMDGQDIPIVKGGGQGSIGKSLGVVEGGEEHAHCEWFTTIRDVLVSLELLHDLGKWEAERIRPFGLARIAQNTRVVEYHDKGGGGKEVFGDATGTDTTGRECMSGSEMGSVAGHNVIHCFQVQCVHNEYGGIEIVFRKEPDKMDAHGTNRPLFFGFFGRSHFAVDDNLEHRQDRSS